MVQIGQFEFLPGNGLCPAACPLHGPVSPDWFARSIRL